MPNQYGQTVIDPRAQLLMGRAMRNEPIETPMALIGRLAALGVGQNRQSGFEEQIAQARLGYGQAMQQAGTDPSARLALLSQAMGSPDPMIRADAMRQFAVMTQPQEQPELFRPLSAEEAQAAGLPPGTAAQMSSRGKISTLYSPPQEAGPTTSVREFTDVFGRPPESPEEFARFQAMKRPPGATVNVNTGPGFKVPAGFMLNETGDGVVPIPGAGTETPQQRRQAEEAAAAKARADKEAAQAATIADAAASYRAAVQEWRQAPTNAAAIAKARAAQERMVQELAAKRSAPRAPTDADVEQARTSVPDPFNITQGIGAMQNVDPFDAALSVTEQELGIKPAQPAAQPGVNMTPAQLRRLADLLEKAKQ